MTNKKGSLQLAPASQIGGDGVDRSDVIALITETYEQDENGVWRNTGDFWKDENGDIIRDENGQPIKLGGEREVFAQVDSVAASEFFEGGRNGLNPEYRFTLFAYDYNGERIVKYNGLFYAIYRTYFAKTDIIELYAERKGGTNGGH